MLFNIDPHTTVNLFGFSVGSLDDGVPGTPLTLVGGVSGLMLLVSLIRSATIALIGALSMDWKECAVTAPGGSFPTARR